MRQERLVKLRAYYLSLNNFDSLEELRELIETPGQQSSLFDQIFTDNMLRVASLSELLTVQKGPVPLTSETVDIFEKPPSVVVDKKLLARLQAQLVRDIEESQYEDNED